MSSGNAFAVVERARKAAKISEFDMLVPPRGERAGKYWGRYNAALQKLLAEIDSEWNDLRGRHQSMTDRYASVVAELAECKNELQGAKVEATCHRIGLNGDQRQQLIAG